MAARSPLLDDLCTWQVRTSGAGDGKKDRWVRIGATFLNKDGSETVLLDALPTKGKLQLRTPKPKEDTAHTSEA